MWTGIYPLCREFLAALHFLFQASVIGRWISADSSILPKVLIFGYRLIFRCLDGERLRMIFAVEGWSQFFAFFPKRAAQVTQPASHSRSLFSALFHSSL
jgi:hypothetical protein